MWRLQVRSSMEQKGGGRRSASRKLELSQMKMGRLLGASNTVAGVAV